MVFLGKAPIHPHSINAAQYRKELNDHETIEMNIGTESYTNLRRNDMNALRRVFLTQR